jgi:hypothetical protein
MFPPTHPSRARRRRLSVVAATAAGSLLATGLVLQYGPAQAQPERPAGPVDPQVTHKVTLVTGDVVTVTTLADGKQIADVDRPDNAVGGVRMQEAGGDLYVVPDEAVALLGAKKLDRRLFNVTDLIEMGYDDASVATVPMIATFKVAKTRTAPATPKASTMVRRLPSVHGAALTTRKQKARVFWTSVAPRRNAGDRTPTLGEGVAKL